MFRRDFKDSRPRWSDGALITPMLPPVGGRWTANRKAGLIAAVRWGKITVEDVLRRYSMSREEFDAIAALVDAKDFRALRVKHKDEVELYAD